MSGSRRLLAATVAVGCVAVCAPAVRAGTGASPSTTPSIRVPVAQTALAVAGRLEGTVTDERGLPVSGAAVMAQGSELVFAVSDGAGCFVFRDMKPGPYLVRAQRPGYAASRRAMVEVLSAGSTRQALRVSRLAPAGYDARRVLAAGVGGDPAADTSLDVGETAGEDHDHRPVSWRLRHLKRSVLRDVTAQDAIAVEDTAEVASFTGSGGSAPFDFGASFLSSLTGEVQLLTASSFDSPDQLFAALPPMGVTYVALGAPAGSRTSWTAQGAFARGEVSSWVLGGSYAAAVWERHAFDVGATYSAQRYEGTSPASLVAMREGDRYVGAVHGFDRWRVSEGAVLSYGLRYAHYGYLDEPGLMSPSIDVRWTAAEGTWLRALVSQRTEAPGAEEFVPSSMAGMWLPPQRTFMPLPGTELTPETARHVEFALERQLGGVVLAARGFAQSVDDQMVTVFGVRVGEVPRQDLGHYYTGAAGDVRAIGWGVSVSRPAASRVRGQVEYTVTATEWVERTADEPLAARVPAAVRPPHERIHDVTAVVETDIPETATRVYAAYKINTGFATAQLPTGDPRLDVRFDVQVSQRLPFLSFTSADWQVLVAVRNLFRDGSEGASVYDELLVIRPPKRIVGGLLVKF